MDALNLTHSPENREFWVLRPILSVRAQAMQEARYRRVPTCPPGVADSIELHNGR